MATVRLPVSGLDVALRLPVGQDDLLLLESGADDTSLALALVAGLAQLVGAAAGPATWADLPATDLDVLLLRLRQLAFGSSIQAEASCPSAGCAARIDTLLDIDAYLAHCRPRAARGAVPGPEPGWFRLRGSEASFRLPTAADQLAVAGQARPALALLQRCVRAPTLDRALARRIEAAMSALAPSLAQDLQGVCPVCGASVAIYFDPRHFTLQELRGQAQFIMQDVHLLALHYHWTEEHILTLPRGRRLLYAEMIRQERGLA